MSGCGIETRSAEQIHHNLIALMLLQCTLFLTLCYASRLQINAAIDNQNFDVYCSEYGLTRYHGYMF